MWRIILLGQLEWPIKICHTQLNDTYSKIKVFNLNAPLLIEKIDLNKK